MKIAFVSYHSTTNYQERELVGAPPLTDSETFQLSRFAPITLTPEHAYLCACLTTVAEVEVVSWEAEDYDWDTADMVLIKEPWNYFEKSELFLKWLYSVQNCMNTIVWNAPESMIWNFDKKYLLELEDNGIAIFPTLFVHNGQVLPTMIEILQRFNLTAADSIVVKPSISGGSFETHRIHLSDSNANDEIIRIVTQVLHFSSALIQPFVKEIVAVGEYSLIFLAGEFSHCVLKKPSKDNYFVQASFGGTSSLVEISHELIDVGRSIIKVAESLIISKRDPRDIIPIARVDGILRDGKFLLSELEVIEPFLYFNSYPSGLTRLKEVIVNRLLSRTTII